MKLDKGVAILVLGILIGMASSGQLSPIAAQGVTTPPRLSLISGNATAIGLAGLTGLNFVKDSRTNACWLLASTAQNVALTPAPTDACQ
jgi:hypothetical protein